MVLSLRCQFRLSVPSRDSCFTSVCQQTGLVNTAVCCDYPRSVHAALQLKILDRQRRTSRALNKQEQDNRHRSRSKGRCHGERRILWVRVVKMGQGEMSSLFSLEDSPEYHLFKDL
jgi:hypothetical protein